MKNNKLLIILSSLVAIYAIIGFVALPKILKPQIEKIINENITQKATLKKIEFNPFLLKFSAIGLKIFDDKETTISAEKLFIDFSIFKSIDEQHISFKDLELVNPYINIIEYEDGTINLQKLVKPTKDNDNKETESKSNIKFQIYRTILNDARLKFTKYIKNEEPFKLDVDKLNYTFYDMGTHRNTLASHSLKILINKNSELIINGGVRLDPFEMNGNVELKNFKPYDFLTYKKDLLNFDLNKEAYLNFRFGYKVNTKDALKIEIDNANLDLKNLNITQKKNSILSLKHLAIEDLNLDYPENIVSIDSIHLNNFNSNIINDKENTLNFANLIKQNNNKVIQEKTIKEEKIENKPIAISKSDTKEKKLDNKNTTKQKSSHINPWKVSLKDLTIKDSNISFNDIANAIFIDTKDINIDLNNLKLNGNDFTLEKVALSKPTINIKDEKNKVEVLNKELKLLVTNLSSKNSIIKLKKLDLNNNSISFKDLQNSLNILTGKIDINLINLIKEEEDVSLEKITLMTPNISFNDNKNKLEVKTGGLNLNLDAFTQNSENINLVSLLLSTPKVTFNDKKNRISILTNNINVKLNNLTQNNETMSIKSVSLNNPKLTFKDNKKKLHIFTKKTSLNIASLKKVKDNITIGNIKFKNPYIFVRDYTNSLKVLTNSLSLDVENLKLAGSNINIKKTKVKTPSVKFDNLNTKLKVTTKNINLIASNTSLIKEKLKIGILSLTKPSVYLVDNKNNTSLVAKKISLKINNIYNYKNHIKVSKVNLYEPNLEFKDKNSKTDILAKNIYLNVQKISHKNNKLKIVRSSLNKPYISVRLGEKPPLAKKEEKKLKEDNKVVKKEIKKPKNKKSDFAFDIGPVKIKNMKMTFEDKNLPIPFKTDITKLNGEFSRLNSNNSKPTKLSLEGTVDEYGYTKITGTVDINDIKLLTDTNLLFKNIAIKNFTPYSGKFIGREIENGKLNLDLKYNIKKSDLNASNSVIISDIKLGKNVKSPEAVNLPLELAIALLEDSNGIIDINLPVTGNVDDPQFSIAPIVWKVFFNLIMKAITSPFALLGAMLGVDEDKLKSLDFEYGKSELIASEKESLDNIAKILSKKPKLAIKIKPVYSPIKDKIALQNIKFEQFLIKEMDKIPEGDDYKEALEDLYEDIDGVKDLDEIEKSYTKEDKDGKKQFNTDAYVEHLRKFLSSRYKVTTEELSMLAKKRIETINKYLLEVKKVNKKAIIIEEISKQETVKDKWAIFNLDVSTR